MPNEPTLKAKLTMSVEDFQAALKKAADGAQKAKKGIGASLKNLGTAPFRAIGGVIKSLVTGPLAALSVGIAGALAGKAIYSGISNVYDAGAALYRLSERTGATVGGLAQLRGAFIETGEDAEGLGGFINKLQRQIETGSTAFDQLGINRSSLKSLAPDQQFILVGKAIANIVSPSERAAVAMKLFGRSGGQLLAVFQSEAFQEAGGELTGKAKIMADNAETFYKASLALAKAGRILKGFYTGIAGGIGEAILPALEKLSNINLVGIGMRIGKQIGGALQIFFRSNDPFQYVIETLKSGLASTVAFFATKVADALDSIASGFGNQASNPIFGNILGGISVALGTAASSVLKFAGSMNAAAAAAQMARNRIGLVSDPEKVVVDGRDSIFANQGMKFKSPGVQFGPGMQFQNAFRETAGGALQSGGLKTGTLSSGGLLTGAAYDADRSARRAAALKKQQDDAKKGTTVNSPSIEALLSGIKENTEGLAE